jgi:hypothetical protein
MNGKRTLLLCTFLLYAALLTPFLQYEFGLVGELPLQGAIEEAKDHRFSVSDWKNESFQKDKESYLNQHFGFRNSLVRLNNQIYYTVYNLAKANGVVVGKNGYLLEENYINDYYGLNFVGQKRINEVTRRLVSIDSAFRVSGKILLVVFPPGKASYYPEYIPDRFQKHNDSTNFKNYREAIAHAGIRYIDFASYFNSLKNTSPYPLYPKTGIHWSEYGAVLAIDSINRFLAKEMSYDPVQVYWEAYTGKDSVSSIDADIEDGMNLLYPISKPRYFYPSLKYYDQGKHKPKVFTSGDSFYRNIFTREICSRLFDAPGFGYYFKEINSPFIGGVQDVSTVDVKTLLDAYDVVMLMQTEATMLNFPFDFDKIVYDYYCGELADPAVFKQRLEELKNSMRNNPKWYESIVEKAKERNIAVEDMLQIDAMYTLHHQGD